MFNNNDGARVCSKICLNGGGSLYLAVDDFVAAKASDFNKSQQRSTSGMQQVQYQLVRNNKFQ